jgi:hypothetical protein
VNWPARWAGEPEAGAPTTSIEKEISDETKRAKTLRNCYPQNRFLSRLTLAGNNVKRYRFRDWLNPRRISLVAFKTNDAILVRIKVAVLAVDLS